MKDREIVSGEVIYQEGDPGDAVFIIQEGEIEVLREVGGEQVRLAVLRKGAIFGESGVIRDKPRSTTTRALGPVTLLTIPKKLFLDTFQRNNPLALPLLQTLCERLLKADSQLIEQRLYSEGARLDEIGRMRLLAASPEVEAQIGSDGMVITDLPFRVGRHAQAGEKADSVLAELMLQISGSTQVSPRHFAIEEIDGRLMLRDLDSHLGTLINGERIAHFERTNIADLRFGENRVQAGGQDSVYRFLVIVERKEG